LHIVPEWASGDDGSFAASGWQVVIPEGTLSRQAAKLPEGM